ncbi:MAG: hypothetical protein A2050_08445 [Candidatus Rokubacteria bacterium GWA2_73_35]|nr:MAG: hypothetical protein A2050_08445 [Candidatus Rokubacteria bacterium GWA2_73_35]
MERIVRLIRIFPLRLPMSSPHSMPAGTSRATGRPCFVMTTPSGPTRSSSARHFALNSVAGICFMLAV